MQISSQKFLKALKQDISILKGLYGFESMPEAYEHICFVTLRTGVRIKMTSVFRMKNEKLDFSESYKTQLYLVD